MRILKALATGLALATIANGASFGGPDAIRIAIVNDQSGPFSAHGGRGSVIATQLAVDEFNKTILGKPIEVLSADHQNKPDLASSITRKMIDADNVDAFVDGASSAATLVIQNVTREKKRIFLITGGAASALTGKECSPTGFHLVPDTYSLSRGVALATVRSGGNKWFFLTADFAFGHALETDATAVVVANKGQIVGSVRHPVNTMDFSSYLLRAQSSGANVLAFANAGTDLVNALLQTDEYRLKAGGLRTAAFLLDVPDLKAMGLRVAGGVQFVLPFYWELNDETRAWSKRFREASGGLPPTRIHAMTYAGVLHYLKSMKAAGTDDAATVAKVMRETPMNDMLNKNVVIREDGRVMTDLFLFQAKKPEESTGPDDVMKKVNVVPAEEVFRTLSEGGCPEDRR